jgi:hypothetical protein
LKTNHLATLKRMRSIFLAEFKMAGKYISVVSFLTYLQIKTIPSYLSQVLWSNRVRSNEEKHYILVCSQVARDGTLKFTYVTITTTPGPNLNLQRQRHCNCKFSIWHVDARRGFFRCQSFVSVVAS